MLEQLDLASAKIALAALIAASLATPALLAQQATAAPKQETAKASATGGMIVPICTSPAKGYRRIGWGKYGLHYDVPKSRVKVLGGKPDVDYVEYVIRPKDSRDGCNSGSGCTPCHRKLATI